MDVRHVPSRLGSAKGKPAIQVRPDGSKFVLSLEFGDAEPSLLTGHYESVREAEQAGIALGQERGFHTLYIVDSIT